jgi:hypothetical protein
MKWMDGNKDSPIRKDELNRIHKNLFQQQQRWKETWKEIRDYINPYLGFFEEDTPNSGQKRDDKLISTKVILSTNTHAAGMQNGITSPTRQWVKLTIADPDIAKLEEVRYWCDDVTQLMNDVFSKSNFYSAAHMFYKERGVFGTAAMMIVEDDETVIHCRTFTMGEYAIANDRKGRVRRMARLMRMTCAEIVEMFGLDNCPQQIQDQFRAKNYEGYYEVKWLMLPNTMVTKGKIDKWNKPFLSLYWMNEGAEDEFLEVGGFDEWPAPCSRWDLVGANSYGNGPGHYALSESKSAQVIDEDIHIGVKKGVDPPMIAPSDVLKSGGVNTLPNGITFYEREYGDTAVKPAMQVQLNIREAKELKAEKEAIIDKHFFVDLFRMLEGIDNGNITAREIIERVQEKMSLIGPAYDLLQSEFLRPVIERVFGIMLRNGMLPEPPEVIQGMDIKIEYVSVMAQAQKMNGLTSVDQFLEFVARAAQIRPDVADKVDLDEGVDRYGEMLSVPPSLILSDERVAQIRQARAEREQQMQTAEMGMQAAQGAKTLADTPMDTNSALNALLGGQVQ